MDEGLNSFMQYRTEKKWAADYPSRRGPVEKAIKYMASEQHFLEPIMSNPENIQNLGSNAYTKTATALTILRETIMGNDLFDYSFKTYANRWRFKQPTPEDFFRTMEDASAVDLDWFWRGWFFSTDYVDIGIKQVKQYFVTAEPNKEVRDYLVKMNRKLTDLAPLVYAITEGTEDYKPEVNKAFQVSEVKPLDDFLKANYTTAEREKLLNPSYFYEVVFNKPGGLVMPILVEITFEDDTKENHTFPAQIWRMNDEEAVRVFATNKRIKKILLDPNLETADTDKNNNVWPKLKEEIKEEE
jgi:aminopeptidase N